MPYIWVGRYSFDLSEVVLVARHVGGEPGLTITLRTGATAELGATDAEAFLKAWDDHAAPQPIERGPPRVLGARLILPVAGREADRREQERFIVGHAAGGHDQA